MSNARPGLTDLESHWQVRLPPAFHRVYHVYEQPFLTPCEFLPLDDLLQNVERWSGMLPQFLPFGHDGAEDFYGFYVPPTTSQDDYPVLYWDHEYDHYYPIASGFDSFLRWCVIHGRYLAQDSFEEGDPELEEEEQHRREFVETLGLPLALMRDAVPRNDRELYERLATSDPQSAQAMAQLGSISLGRGDMGRARDFFVRASEATPWFADPYYLIGETYLTDRRPEEAVPRWWQVLQSPIALSTRTANYDLGEDHPDAEIYEAAIDRLSHYENELPAEQRNSPLGRMILREDPFEAAVRLRLAAELHEKGDMAGEERELLNALALATEDGEIAEAYDRLIALYERGKRHREAAFCQHDRAV